MSDTPPFDVDAYIQAEVDRAVAPYVGRMPAWALDKMRELAQRYWHENPVALESIRRKQRRVPDQSGTVGPSAPAAGDQGETSEEKG
jgi:transaldolase